jgi:predicted lipid-binding transport protein (Tim44 family)
MGNDTFLIEIVLFAAIAGFLIVKLRSVLGRRHGEERKRPNPFGAPAESKADNVVRMPERLRPADPAADGPLPIAAQIEQVRTIEPQFNENAFASGARAAFEMIVGAFAAGDKQTLRPLLADDVYATFADAIDARAASGQRLETEIVTVEEPDIKAARISGRFAYVTIRFISQQINVTRNADGEVIEGDTDTTVEVTDLWTFARDTRNPDPNWVLVETSAPA